MSNPSPRSPDPEAVADRLHSAAIHLLRRLRREDSASGLGPARLSALSVLVFAGPASLGELAAAEQVTAATMSRIARGLERQGLAARRRDRDDARVYRLRATARGARLLRAARRRRVRALSELLAGMSRRELETVEEALALLERAFQGAEKPIRARRTADRVGASTMNSRDSGAIEASSGREDSRAP